MATTEERLAFLEGTVGEHSHMLNGVKDAIASLEARVDARLQGFEERMDRRLELVDRRYERIEHRMDKRFEQVDARFVQIDTRFVQMEARFSQVDARIDSLDAKMSRHFVWLVGILLTAMTAVLGILGAITSAILGGRI